MLLTVVGAQISPLCSAVRFERSAPRHLAGDEPVPREREAEERLALTAQLAVVVRLPQLGGAREGQRSVEGGAMTGLARAHNMYAQAV